MPPGAYISYPFCAQKCTYCNFASGVFPRALEREYVDCLLKEIARHEWDALPDTVYLGGGTPSLIEPRDLAGLLAAIPGRPWREATMEAAPGSLSEEGCRAWADAGINRVSLGVQSFVTREAARTGRKHTAEIVAREVALLRRDGISNINIDLIAGLPGQTPATWRESLDWIERLGVPHVSVYMLEVDEDSRLGQEVLLNGKRYGAPDVPEDEVIVELYQTAVERLQAIEIERYEISNFARRGCESIHNLKYWRMEPYIGFGADAHSFDGRLRWQNVEDAGEYVARIQREESPRAGCYPAVLEQERWFLGLRTTEGVSAQEGRHTWERFIDLGLVEEYAGRIRLTDRGVLFSNEVFAEFV